MLLQLYKSYLIISMIKYVEAQEYRSHWAHMKKSEVRNNHKNKYGKLKTIYQFLFQAQEITRRKINETQG